MVSLYALSDFVAETRLLPIAAQPSVLPMGASPAPTAPERKWELPILSTPPSLLKEDICFYFIKVFECFAHMHLCVPHPYWFFNSLPLGPPLDYTGLANNRFSVLLSTL